MPRAAPPRASNVRLSSSCSVVARKQAAGVAGAIQRRYSDRWASAGVSAVGAVAHSGTPMSGSPSTGCISCSRACASVTRARPA
eukprot:256298-Lingulodinium_polyedra.AAC.1